MTDANSIPEKRLGMMTKYWEPGKVKTRLAASWANSPEALSQWRNTQDKSLPIAEAHAFAFSARMHRLFVHYLLDQLQSCGTIRDLIGAPYDRLGQLTAETHPAWRVVDQGEGNLGERMSRWFLSEPRGDSQESGANSDLASHKVMIGSDCPLLDTKVIAEAFRQLENHDLVLGPASDGGYYLIGMPADANGEQLQKIFDGIAWSTEEVLPETLRAAEQIGWRVALLETQDDVDLVEDLNRLIVRAQSQSEHSEFFNSLVDAINSNAE